jgi:hypothetical protein
VRLAQGRRAEAVRALKACRAASEDLFTDNPNVLPSRSALATALAADDPDEARRLVREELGLARRRRQPRAIGVALRAQGSLEPGEHGVEALSEAVAVLASSPARLAHAGALSDLGGALASHARREEARERLQEALAMALRCGATALVTTTAGRLATLDGAAEDTQRS